MCVVYSSGEDGLFCCLTDLVPILRLTAVHCDCFAVVATELEKEILSLTQRLLNVIDEADFQEYW